MADMLARNVLIFILFKKIIMKTIFIYDNKILATELLVLVGIKLKDLEKWAKKYSSKLEKILKDVPDNIEYMLSQQGSFYGFNNGKHTVDILYLDKWEKGDNYSSLLLHELVHYKQSIFRERKIKDEEEFESYFIQNTWRELKIILDKKIKK